MDEQTLQALSKALTHLVFRNGIVENLHAASANLDDETMKQLNIDINNRIYTVLDIWFNGTEEEVERLERILNFLARYYGNSWNQAEWIDLLMREENGKWSNSTTFSMLVKVFRNEHFIEQQNICSCFCGMNVVE